MCWLRAGQACAPSSAFVLKYGNERSFPLLGFRFFLSEVETVQIARACRHEASRAKTRKFISISGPTGRGRIGKLCHARDLPSNYLFSSAIFTLRARWVGASSKRDN